MPVIARENADGPIEEITFEELRAESGFTEGLLELIEKDEAGWGSQSFPDSDERYIWAPTKEDLPSDVYQAIRKDAFVFTFSTIDANTEEDVVTKRTLPLTDFSEAKDAKEWIRDEGMEKVQEKLDARELETRYGIHDFSAGSNDEYYELIGYDTYEVDVDEQRSLMEEWREILTELGFEVGDEETEETFRGHL